MLALAGHGAFDPAQALAVGHNADLLTFSLQNRALFDMQLEKGVHLALADLFRAFPADPLQLIAKAFALGIDAVIGPVLIEHTGKHARGEHCGGKAGAFLIGPVGDDDGVFGLDVEIIEGADKLKPGEHAQYAVIFAARRLGIKVRADIDRQGVGVRAFAAGKHRAHLIDTHGQARLLAPGLEQLAPLTVFIREGLAIVAARDAGADLGHLHQTVPQALAIDFQVFTGCGHVVSPLLAGQQTLAIGYILTVWSR